MRTGIELPKIRGTLLGGPHNKDYSILGAIHNKDYSILIGGHT